MSGNYAGKMKLHWLKHCMTYISCYSLNLKTTPAAELDLTGKVDTCALMKGGWEHCRSIVSTIPTLLHFIWQGQNNLQILSVLRSQKEWLFQQLMVTVSRCQESSNFKWRCRQS